MRNLKDQIKKFLRHLGLYSWAVNSRIRFKAIIHRLAKSGEYRESFIRKFSSVGEIKLQLGCGERILPGWLNADIYRGDIYIDITKILPLADSSVSRIYSHHLIEHVGLSQLVSLFKEMFRILKPGGRIRLVTPDLKKLIYIYQHPEQNEDIIRHYCQSTGFVHPVEAFNQEMRQNGEHRYIYDFAFLKILLENCGFSGVSEFPYTESGDHDFAGLDDHGYQMIGRISLCLEAEKPASST